MLDVIKNPEIKAEQFIELRLNYLQSQSRERQIETESAKTSSAILFLLTCALSANPVAMAACIIAGTLYGLSLATDFYKTKKLYPLPLLRREMGEIIEAVGTQESFNGVVGYTSYLSPSDAIEYQLLKHFPTSVASYLNSVDKSQRLIAYQWLISAPERGQSFSDLGILPENKVARQVQPKQQQKTIEQTKTQTVEVPPTVIQPAKAIEVIPDPWANLAKINTPQSDPFDRKPTLDPIHKFWEIVDRNMSFFVVGSKGSGKGIIVSNLLRRKLERYPNSVALVLDPKGYDQEKGYWEHPQIFRHSFHGISATREEWGEAVIEFLAEARYMISQVDVLRGKRLFIVFDEFLGLKNNLDAPIFREVKTFCSNSISMGDSSGVHAIAITQSFNAGDSLDSEELLQNLCLLGSFGQDEYKRAKKIVTYGKVNTNELNVGDFLGMVTASPVNRVLTIGGEFIAAPKLKNYSGHDRDALLGFDQKSLTKPLTTSP